ncbi:MAG TPA: hypothetical protein VGI81_16170, partial [Tepidisphaeraceae bacterium]
DCRPSIRDVRVIRGSPSLPLLCALCVLGALCDCICQKRHGHEYMPMPPEESRAIVAIGLRNREAIF